MFSSIIVLMTKKKQNFHVSTKKIVKLKRSALPTYFMNKLSQKFFFNIFSLEVVGGKKRSGLVIIIAGC